MTRANVNESPSGHLSLPSLFSSSSLWTLAPPPRPHPTPPHPTMHADGCEVEPVVGARFTCTVCEDRDLCSSCHQALLVAQEIIAGGGEEAERLLTGVSRETVPCLDPTHRYQRVQHGPERAVWFAGDEARVRYDHEDGHDNDGVGGGRDAKASSSSSLLSTWSRPRGISSGMLVAGGSPVSKNRKALEASLATYLAMFPPSRAYCRDVAWIGVRDCSHMLHTTDMIRARAHTQGNESPDVSPPSLDCLHLDESPPLPTPPRSATQTVIQTSDLAAREERLLRAWDRATDKSRRGYRDPTADLIATLARDCGVDGGKWLLRVSPQEVDEVWRALACLVAFGPEGRGEGEGEGGGVVGRTIPDLLTNIRLITAVKVSGRPTVESSTTGKHERKLTHAQAHAPEHLSNPPPPPQTTTTTTTTTNRHPGAATNDGIRSSDQVVCVYTHMDDALDVAALLQSALVARNVSLPNRTIRYKPDAYSVLNIYAGNRWRIKPTILHAQIGTEVGAENQAATEIEKEEEGGGWVTVGSRGGQRAPRRRGGNRFRRKK